MPILALLSLTGAKAAKLPEPTLSGDEITTEIALKAEKTRCLIEKSLRTVFIP